MSGDTQQNHDHSTTAILVVIYALLIVLVFYGSYRFTDWSASDSLKNFGIIVTVGLTAVSAVMGLVTSFVSLHKNQQAGVELEKLKSDLQVNVLFKKIGTDLRFEHEKLKTTAESSAYAKLWTSIDYAYQLLAKLETSSWNSGDKRLMDEALLEARAQLVYARMPEHRTLWETVRQRAYYISEEAAKTEITEQPTLWGIEIAEFADLCGKFKDIANTEINRPPQVQEVNPQ